MSITKLGGLTLEEKQACEATRIASWWYPQPQKRNEVTKDERAKERLCNLYKASYTLRELANWFRTSYETVRTILKDANVPRRKTPRKCKIGLRQKSEGYIKIYMGSQYPGASKNGWMREHRLVMQKAIGRLLQPWEIVHHIDRDRSNNDISNLELLTRMSHPVCISCPYYDYYVGQTGNQFIKIYRKVDKALAKVEKV